MDDLDFSEMEKAGIGFERRGMAMVAFGVALRNRTSTIGHLSKLATAAGLDLQFRIVEADDGQAVCSDDGDKNRRQ